MLTTLSDYFIGKRKERDLECVMMIGNELKSTSTWTILLLITVEWSFDVYCQESFTSGLSLLISLRTCNLKNLSFNSQE